jgi:hypothetical protein
MVDGVTATLQTRTTLRATVSALRTAPLRPKIRPIAIASAAPLSVSSSLCMTDILLIGEVASASFDGRFLCFAAVQKAGFVGKEADAGWRARRARFHDDPHKENDPLVYAQEYLVEFVDWSGVAFFSREKLLVENQPLLLPARCDAIFAVIDTASKTGTDNDATAVTFFAVDRIGRIPLLILDWDIVQMEGAMLETWLPQVFARLEELARLCHARAGSIGAFIEDKNSGTILLQQALRRQMPTRAIDSKLTAMGKDERAISVSGYGYREFVKYTDRAFEKTVIYKRHSRNHLLDQVESFRVGDRDGDREDDLLDTFCYGIALALGDNEGF